MLNPPHAVILAIDIESETIISIEQARSLPAFRNLTTGQPAYASTIKRYIDHGARAADGSRVRLEALKLPTCWATSTEAVARFLGRLTHPESEITTPTPKRRQREIEAAGSELAAMGMT